MKILLHCLWKEGTHWDDPVPYAILESWSQWRLQLPLLSTYNIRRCYFPKHTQISSLQLNSFSDASQVEYAGVVYLRMEDIHGSVSMLFGDCKNESTIFPQIVSVDTINLSHRNNADTIRRQELLFSHMWWHHAGTKWWSTNACGHQLWTRSWLVSLFPNTHRRVSPLVLGPASSIDDPHEWCFSWLFLPRGAIIWMGGCGY